VVADVESPEGRVTVANTHLSFIDIWNGWQLRRLMADLAQGSDPLVLMGDLNMEPRRAARITRMRSAVSAATFPKDTPTQQIDHVLVRGPITPGAGGSVLLPVSDHRALSVALTVHDARVAPGPAAG
jgi:endonuclease/exonuclease/phosphatase family metal-dependent hydrolase